MCGMMLSIGCLIATLAESFISSCDIVRDENTRVVVIFDDSILAMLMQGMVLLLLLGVLAEIVVV